MKELEYPFDNIEILKQQKKYKKILMNNKSLAERGLQFCPVRPLAI